MRLDKSGQRVYRKGWKARGRKDVPWNAAPNDSLADLKSKSLRRGLLEGVTGASADDERGAMQWSGIGNAIARSRGQYQAV